MKIAMFTNTYTPHVGGVAGSVQLLTDKCREAGHEVYVVAPEFPDMPEYEQHVIRIPAIQNFNGSDFSVSLPVPARMRDTLSDFGPDIIHAHHPYLLGDTALRYSAYHDLPLVFTFHTMYEKYTHYVPADSDALKRFVIELSTGFVNLCDHIIAPSSSVKEILRERGADTDISVIPTGVEYDTFATGDGKASRTEMDIPVDAFVLGHVGRLAPEKNLSFLTETVAEYLKQDPESYFLVVGDGPSRDEMEVIFRAADVSDRVRFAGVQKDQALVDSYHAMDLKVFASKSETQGMVLAEAMAAGLPVVALKASGVNDILKSGANGILVEEQDRQVFQDAISTIRELGESEWEVWQEAIDKTAHEFSAQETSAKVFALYEDLYATGHKKHLDDESWDKLMRAIKREWEIWERRFTAGAQSIKQQKPSE